MRSLFFIVLLFFVCFKLNAQQWEWAKKAIITTSAQSSGAICVDSSGNVYTLGVNSQLASYGSTTLTPGTFLLKYNSGGTILWSKKLEYPAVHISCDATSNIYLATSYQNNILTDSAAFSSMGGFDILLVKLDANGTELWAQSYGGKQNDFVGDIANDKIGNCYMTGRYESDTLSFSNYYAIDTLSFGYFYLAKITNSGSTSWVDRGIQDSVNYLYTSGKEITIDKLDRIYVLGEGTICNYQSCSGTFLAKYSGIGQRYYHSWKWVGYASVAHDLEVDDSLHIYVVKNGGNHQDRGTLVKYDSLLNIKWSLHLGAQYGCYGFYDPRVAPNGECFITGFLKNNYNSNCGLVTVDSVYLYDTVFHYKGEMDIMIANINRGGKVSWYKMAGGDGAERGGLPFVDKNSNYYLTGSYNFSWSPPGSLNHPSLFDSHILTNDGQWQQTFVAKIGAHTNLVGLTEMQKNLPTPVNVFPNPSSGVITIKTVEITELHLKLYSATGTVILNEKLNSSQQQINLGMLPRGIYLLEFSNKNGTQTQKLVLD